MKYVIPNDMKALAALQLLYPDSSRRTLCHWIRGKRFTIDGIPLKHDSQILTQGQTLSAQEAFSIKRTRNVKIIFEDRHLVAIDKPVGLLSVPLDAPAAKAHALGLLREHFQTDQILPVHRIDRETSGVMLFARGKSSQDKLKAMFEKHDLEREYVAIVEGRLQEMRGTWESLMRELENYDVETVSDAPDAKLAITHFEVLRRSPKYTYLRLMLETGRKHQIRVHCKEAGFPILGDRRYGAVENPIDRLCLHAHKIAFLHPFTRRAMSFVSPLPFAFKKLGATDAGLFPSDASSALQTN